MKIKFLLVDDHRMVRHGIKLVLESVSGWKVLYEAETPEGAREIIKNDKDIFVILDMGLRDGSGLKVIPMLKQHKIPVLVLSMHDEFLFAERALKAGSNGYLMKDEDPDMLISSIKCILNGNFAISPRMSKKIYQNYLYGITSKESQLTEKEFLVFQHIGMGHSTQEISQHLDVRKKTIDTHRENIKDELGIKTSNQLIKMACEWRLTGK